MNRKMFLALVGFFAICGIFGYLYVFSLDEQIPQTVPQVESEVAPTPSSDTVLQSPDAPPDDPIESIIKIEQDNNAEPYCYISEFNGRLSIYASKDSPIPDIITDIPLSILPVVDQDTIRKGFFVYSEAELSKLLEDLGS